ncbi:MAG: hypothetical protein ACLPX5_16790 [Dissulfurispiraceae bacterium]
MNRNIAAFLLILTWGISFSGCAVQPSESTVRSTIIKHFEERRFKVAELRIGKIQPISLAEKTYMGTAAFNVEIKSITLEVTDGATRPKGQRLIFNDAAVTIKERPDEKGLWIVSDISGIYIP